MFCLYSMEIGAAVLVLSALGHIKRPAPELPLTVVTEIARWSSNNSKRNNKLVPGMKLPNMVGLCECLLRRIFL